jgi:hypothetical protein
LFVVSLLDDIINNYYRMKTKAFILFTILLAYIKVYAAPCNSTYLYALPSSSNYTDPINQLCVAICPSGLYSNNYTQSCVTAINCYSNHVGDPTTNKCI